MRIIGLDVARALALFGMMLVNYKIVFTEGIVKHEGIGKFISLFEGRAAAVFLVLAGIGIAIMSRVKDGEDKDLKQKKIRVTLLKRSLFLFVLGMGLYYLFEWTADILHYYGMYITLMTLLIFKKKKTIIITTLIILLITLILQLSLDYSTGWYEFKDYEDFSSIRGFLRNTFFNGYHPVFPWISFILIGFVVGLSDLTKKKNLVILQKLSLFSAVVLELLSHSLTRTNNELMVYLFDTKPMNPSVLYITAASCFAIWFIVTVIRISDKYRENKLTVSLMKTGQMALTHYVFHSVGVLGIFFILGELTSKSELFVVVLSTVVFLLMMIYSYYRLKKHSRGPFESFMRKCTK